MNRKFLAILLCLSMMIGLSVPIYAASEIEVSAGDNLQQKIDGANAGDIIKLTENHTTSTTISITKKITLDLNGYVLQYDNDSTKGAVIEVGDGGDLTIDDSGGAQQLYAFNKSSTPWVFIGSIMGEDDNVENGSIKGGIITGGTDSGVVLLPGANVTMLGGNIVGCTVTAYGSYGGGGVSLRGTGGTGSFTMGGESRIIGCSETGGYGGGGIYSIWHSGTVTMNNNAAILYCYAKSGGGGGVCITNGGTFKMNGGTISDCTAGGGNIVFVSGSVYANGGIIYGDFSAYNGVSVEKGKKGTTFKGSATIGSIGQVEVSGGIFDGPVSNKGIISGGVFNGPVGNGDKIYGGEFYGEVTNEGGATITGGIFHGKVTNKAGADKITGGTFLGGLDPKPDNTLTVTFDANDGSLAPNTISPQTIVGDSKLIEPDDPTKDGCTFGGWFYDGRKWDFAESAKENGITTAQTETKITLTAAWGYNVSFDGNGGSGTTSLWVKEGETITKPADPTREGYTFRGWMYNGALWDFNTAVSGDMQLVASWEEVRSDSGSSGSSGSSRPHRYSISTPRDLTGGKISVSPSRAERGELVTITVTPDSGYELSKLEVCDSKGKALELTEKGDGKYTFTMPQKNVEIEAVFAKEIEIEPTEELAPSESIAPLPALLFRDVPENAYYYEAVLWAVQRGITAGTDGDLFSPNAACTRAQIVTFLWRAAGSPEPVEMSSFADVPADCYYAKAVAWAVENGITSGTDAEHFSPDAACTRAQSVTFLYRALGEGEGGQAGFADVPADSYYADAVAWAAENGVTTGIGGGLFGSEQSCTRAQIVTFLYHAYQKIA